MTALPPPAYGVLSQNFRQELEHLATADPPAFDQAQRHLHMGHYDGGGLVRDRSFSRWGRFRVSGGRFHGSALVETAFLQLAFGFAVVSNAAPGGLLPAVRLAAAEGTAQVVAASVPEVGEEVDPAVPTTS
jgi:hypothetical protein